MSDPTEAERIYQASPAACVSVARKAIRAAWAELDRETPDLQAVRTQMGVARAWLPGWLEQAWDDQMCEWLHRTGAPRGREYDEEGA